MFFSPLEQFQIYPLMSFKLGVFDLSFTNGFLIILISLFSFLIFLEIISSTNRQIYFFPKNWQIFIETIYLSLSTVIVDNIGEKGQKFFPFVFSISFVIFLSNLTGSIPYSFAVTSHLIVIFSLALTLFITITIVCIKKYGFNMINFFIPSGTSLALAFILVPIEIASHSFKPISLTVRLFSNIMSGHTLLKVIVKFAWVMISASDILHTFHFIPLTVLILLGVLELVIALIQTYVFTFLICIYLNEVLNLY